jgi:ring-1,2-phenylacetyl-CoA epoxidase subunit PaaA
MFRDKIELKGFDKTDAEYKDLLGRVLAIQADCEIGGPYLYVKDMLPTAPTKMDQLIVARTAAEEIDHFRKVARVARDIGVDVSYVLSWPNEKRYLEAFRGLINTWGDYAVFGFLIERVGLYQLEEFSDCTYVALPQILPEIIKEELGHIGFGTNKTAELAAKGDEQKEKVQSAVNFWYIKALTCSATRSRSDPSDSSTGESNAEPTLEAREEYIREVSPLIETMGLHVPDPVKGRKYL